jgi:pimeloyl-ACP methyl ester carboxylesterase
MNEPRYRAAEARLFADAGISPREHWVALASTGTDARVLEVGDGEPIVFLHGGPMAAGTWAYVAAALASTARCLLVERPGCGLSAPPRTVPTPGGLAAYVAGLSADILDSFGLARASFVGSSFGGYSALCTAAGNPERVGRVILAGCPPFVPGWQPPAFFNVVKLPIVGRLVLAAPATKVNARMFLKQMGHGPALADGRISPAMLDWTLAWQRDTDTMRNDVAMIKVAAFEPSVDLDDDDFKRITAPCLFLAGTHDRVGDDRVVVSVANRLPDAQVEVWDGSGHLPWLDDPLRAAASIRAFVA